MENGLILEPESSGVSISRRKKERMGQPRTLRIKVKPTKDEIATLKRWFGSVRYTYNQCLGYLKTISDENFKRYLEKIETLCDEDEEMKKIKTDLDETNRELERVTAFRKSIARKRDEESKQARKEAITKEKSFKTKRRDLFAQRKKRAKEIIGKLEQTVIPSANTLRDKFVLSTSSWVKERAWLTDMTSSAPKETREQAVFDLRDAMTVQLAQMRNGVKPKFDMKYRSSKRDESIMIPTSGFVTNEVATRNNIAPWSFYQSQFANMRFVVRRYRNRRVDRAQLLWDRLLDGRAELYNSRLVKRGRDYYLHLSYSFETELQRADDIRDYGSPPEGMSALDPGCDYFQTVYDEFGGCLIEYGDRKATTRLVGMREKAQRALNSGKKRLGQKLMKRARNLRDEMHRKVICDLIRRARLIVCPEFKVQGMNRRGTGKSKNKGFAALSHYLFRQRLESKCAMTDRLFVLGKEPYTSRTCGVCMHVNDKFAKRTDEITCRNCGVTLSRDGNGARNNLLVFLNALKKMSTVA